MKRRMPWILALVLVCLAGLQAPGVMAQDGRDTDNRWEISFLFGQLNGSAVDNPDMSCTALTTDGCNPFEDFSHDGIGGFPGRGALAATSLLQTGHLVPGDGAAWGLRVGLDLSPRWQIELSSLYGTADSSLSNAEVIGSYESAFATSTPNNKAFAVLDRAAPRGTQQFHMINVKYMFNETGKVVPYIGAGIGMAKFYNHPDVSLFVQTDGFFGFSQILIEKSAGDDETVAVDFLVGVKIHATPHFGIRMEVMDIVSAPEFTHQFRVIDINDNFGGGVGSVLEPSGSLTQKNTYNHIFVGIGAFWAF